MIGINYVDPVGGGAKPITSLLQNEVLPKFFMSNILKKQTCFSDMMFYISFLYDILGLKRGLFFIGVYGINYVDPFEGGLNQ